MIVNKSLFKNRLKKIILGTSVFAFFMMLGIGDSKAVLQSNGNGSAVYGVDEWMSNIRKMESLGGAMGLEETINSNLTSSSASNNIDVHMQKNTEYGALAILSASSYGNSSKINNGDTTTGNITGVVMKLNKEWVAAGAGITSSSIYKNAVSRYKNVYNVTEAPSMDKKIGDATLETRGWHGSGASVVISARYIDSEYSKYVAKEYSGLVRSYSGSIFSYYGYGLRQGSGYFQYSEFHDAYYQKTWASRAVVVIGEGL